MNDIIARISSLPIVSVPEPIDTLDTWEYYAAEIAHLTRSPIDFVGNATRIGRVIAFKVQPANFPDPTVIVCRDADLRSYYNIVGMIFNGRHVWNVMAKFDQAIETFIQTARLSRDEIGFGVANMLIFKNEVLLR